MFKLTELNSEVDPNNFDMGGRLVVGNAATKDGEQHMVIVIDGQEYGPGEVALPSAGLAFRLTSAEDFAEFMIYLCDAATRIWGAENICLHFPDEVLQ